MRKLLWILRFLFDWWNDMEIALDNFPFPSVFILEQEESGLIFYESWIKEERFFRIFPFLQPSCW